MPTTLSASSTAGDAEVIVLSGRLDAADAPALEATVGTAIDRGLRRVVLDLSQVHSAGADGAEALAAALRAAVSAGTALSAVGIRPGLIPEVHGLVAGGLDLRGTVQAAVGRPPAVSRGPESIISSAVGRLMRTLAGRGPSSTRTLISPQLVVVTLRDCLTCAEKTLVERGQGGQVTRMRSELHEAMRAEATAAVETAIAKPVVAFLADQHTEPDVAVVAFVLAGPGSD